MVTCKLGTQGRNSWDFHAQKEPLCSWLSEAAWSSTLRFALARCAQPKLGSTPFLPRRPLSARECLWRRRTCCMGSFR